MQYKRANIDKKTSVAKRAIKTKKTTRDKRLIRTQEIEMEKEKLHFWLHGWKIQGLKTIPGFKLDGLIPVEDAATAAVLLVESQKTGYALRITAEVVRIADEKY